MAIIPNFKNLLPLKPESTTPPPPVKITLVNNFSNIHLCYVNDKGNDVIATVPLGVSEFITSDPLSVKLQDDNHVLTLTSRNHYTVIASINHDTLPIIRVTHKKVTIPHEVFTRHGTFLVRVINELG